MFSLKSGLAGASFALAVSLGAGPADAYVFGTPDVAINTDGWALFGGNMDNFRSALTDPSNFGPAGTVTTPITLQQLTVPNAANLAGVDGLIVPWWLDSQSSAFAADIVARFKAGMDLVLFEDDTTHDGIGQLLGIPTSGSSGSLSTAQGSFASGPFGSPAANSISQVGNVGRKLIADIAARGGVVAASNGGGQATAAYWAPGTFDGISTAGALFVFGDVDMVSDFGFATYSPLNDNGIFALNAIATVITATGGGVVIEEPPVGVPPVGVPVPASIVLFGAGLLGLAGLRRRA